MPILELEAKARHGDQYVVRTNAGSAVITHVYDRHEDRWDWEIETDFRGYRTGLYYGHRTFGSAVNHLWRLVAVVTST